MWLKAQASLAKYAQNGNARPAMACGHLLQGRVHWSLDVLLSWCNSVSVLCSNTPVVRNRWRQCEPPEIMSKVTVPINTCCVYTDKYSPYKCDTYTDNVNTKYVYVQKKMGQTPIRLCGSSGRRWSMGRHESSVTKMRRKQSPSSFFSSHQKLLLWWGGLAGL